MFCENRDSYTPHVNRGFSSRQISDLRREYVLRFDREMSLKRMRLIVCAESLTNLSGAGVRRLRNYCDAYSRAPKILAYVREPVSFASSSFQQEVKMGCSEFRVPRPEYERRFARFIEVFGLPNIEFVRYERSSFVSESVLRDFCARVGIPSDAIRERKKNMSLSAEATRVLLAFNRSHIESFGTAELHGRRARFIGFVATVLRGSPFRIPAALVAPEIDGSDLSWMEEFLGSRLLDVDTLPRESEGLELSVGPETLELLRRESYTRLGISRPPKKLVELFAAMFAAV